MKSSLEKSRNDKKYKNKRRTRIIGEKGKEEE
jgi:hypothetical protein